MSLAVPVPNNWAAGNEPVFGDFNTYIRDTMNFLSAETVLRVHQATVQSIPNNTITVVTLDTVDEDSYSGWSNTTHQYTAQVDGWYMGIFDVQLVNGGVAGSVGQVYAMVNGAAALEVSDTPSAFSASVNGYPGFWYGYLRGGIDTFQAGIFQLSGGALNTSVTVPNQCSTLELIWMSS